MVQLLHLFHDTNERERTQGGIFDSHPRNEIQIRIRRSASLSPRELPTCITTMSSSAPPALTSLARPRTAVVLCTAVAAAVGIYYLHSSVYTSDQRDAQAHSPGNLTRSNAIYRRRARNRAERSRLASNDTIDDQDEDTLVDGSHNGLLPETPLPVEITEVAETEIGDGDQFDWENRNTAEDRRGQNVVGLLFRVSEDATRRNAYVHRGTSCNSCHDIIRGVRYSCANCVDYDLCEQCESQNRHTKTHVFLKIRIPTSGAGARSVLPLWYPGNPESENAMKPLDKELVTRLMKETGFERPELDAMFEIFTFSASEEWREDPDGIHIVMNRQNFDRCIVPSSANRNAAPSLLHDRMFAFFDTNGDEKISFAEYCNGIAFRKKKDKTKRIFHAYDLDGDGNVSRKDFLRMFRAYYQMTKQRQQDMVDSIQEQGLNDLAAQKLISGSQPLSSHFSPLGDITDPRRIRAVGKAINRYGDAEISDGGGIVSEDSRDEGIKDDALLQAVTRRETQDFIPIYYPQSDQNTDSEDPLSQTGASFDEIQHEILDGLIQHRTPARHQRLLWESASQASGSSQQHNEETERHTRSMSGTASISARRDATFSRQNARQRRTSVGQIQHERWQRREFYTDEEEGTKAPADWDEEEDISYSVRGGNDSRSSQRRRSSSKVHFVDDDGHSEGRSSSSGPRNFPERYGGGIIPQAEIDAGKEILFQVTQEACNELLDVLFKKQEDDAFTAMANKKEREKDEYKRIIDNEAFERWAEAVDATNDSPSNLGEIKKASSSYSERTLAWGPRPTITEVELGDVRQRPLDHLLQAAGYEVEEGDTATVVDPSSPRSARPPPCESETDDTKDSLASHLSHKDDHQPTIFEQQSDATLSPVRESAEYKHEDVDFADHKTPQHLGSNNLESQDLTMPQFRPDSDDRGYTSYANYHGNQNSAAEVASFEEQQESTDIYSGYISESRSRSTDKTKAFFLHGADKDEEHEQEENKPLPNSERKYPNPYPLHPTIEARRDMALKEMLESGMDYPEWQRIAGSDWIALYELRASNRVEAEAIEKGGWGRLSCKEFELISKTISEENEKLAREGGTRRGPNLDYLGSWIHYFLPA